MADVYYVPDGDTLPIMFTTYDGGTGASITLTGLAVTDIEIYKDGGITQRSSDSGYTLIDTDGIDIDTTTGLHGFTIDLSDNTDAGFYSVGSWFHVVVNAVTVDSQTVVFIPAIFRIMAAEASAGVVDANVASIDANAITATSIASNAITSAKIATDAIGAAQIAADAIGSSELAATAASEISTAVWAETTRVLTANTNLNDPTAAAIADAVWDELQADHVTAATFGVLATEIADILTDTNELQTDDVPGLIAALNDPTAAAIADAVWDEVVSGHQTTGSFGAGYDGTNDVIAADVERWLGSAAATPTTAGVPEVDITYIVGSAQAALGIGVYGEGIDTDTNVSSATSTTVVFDSANMSSVDDYYNNMVAWVYGGTGAGQARLISDYAGGTKTATVDPAWGTNPDTTSDVAILPFGAGAAGSLTAAQVADAVWDELQADHTTAATFGVLATEIADILVDTAEIGVAGAGLTDVALATNAVDADAVAAGAIDSGAIAAGAITAASFAANAITSTVLADSAITAAKLATDAITAAKIAADAIGASELAADAVAEIADAVWDETVSTHQTTGSFGAGYDGTNDAIAADVERWLGTAAATPTTAGVPEVDVTFVAGDSAAATGLQGVYSGVDTDTNVAAATASSIQFNDAGMSAVDNFYSGQVVVVYGGTGAGQARLITSYTGATKTAGIEPDWGTNPDTTSDIAIVPYSIGDTAPPTAAAIADAVWTEQIADHSGTGGSTAEAVANTLTDTAEIGAAGAGLTAIPWNAAWDAEVESEATDALNAYDPPTKTEMDTGFAALNDPTAAAIADAVWDEPTLDHTTAATFGEQAATDIDAILADTNELQTDDIPGTIAALNDISTAQVNAEVVDVLKTDTIAERGVAVPTNTPTFEEAISYLYMALTEKVHVNATTKDFYNAAGTNIWSKALSDDGTDYNEASGA